MRPLIQAVVRARAGIMQSAWHAATPHICVMAFVSTALLLRRGGKLCAWPPRSDTFNASQSNEHIGASSRRDLVQLLSVYLMCTHTHKLLSHLVSLVTLQSHTKQVELCVPCRTRAVDVECPVLESRAESGEATRGSGHPSRHSRAELRPSSGTTRDRRPEQRTACGQTRRDRRETPLANANRTGEWSGIRMPCCARLTPPAGARSTKARCTVRTHRRARIAAPGRLAAPRPSLLWSCLLLRLPCLPDWQGRRENRTSYSNSRPAALPASTA